MTRRKGCRLNSSRAAAAVDAATPPATMIQTHPRLQQERLLMRTAAEILLPLADAADVATRRTGTSPRQPAARIRASAAAAVGADVATVRSQTSPSRGRFIVAPRRSSLRTT